MIRHRDLKIEDARMCAREQLRRFGVIAPEHVDPEAFAAYLNVAVMTVKLDGADAQLIKAGKRVTILLSQRIASPVVRRFTIAHELGHLLLGHPTQIPSRIPAAQLVRAPLVEIEANAFASELLMPATLVREFCDLSRGDLDGPREIANTFSVSILAAAIRYAELAREPLAAVFARNNKVEWAVPSAAMELHIRRGRRLADASLASSFFTSGEHPTEPAEVPETAWFDKPASGRVVEHVACAPSLRTTLSMVWIRREIA